MSEASRRLPDELKERHGNVTWLAIRYAGNVYRHSYDKVSASLVWDSVRNQLDDLWNAVVNELEADRLERPGEGKAV